MNLGEYLEEIEIPEHILYSDPWCNKEWILHSAYFPTVLPYNPRAPIQLFTDEGLGLVALGCRDFIRGPDRYGRGDIELWYDDIPPLFMPVESDTVLEYHNEVKQALREYLPTTPSSREQNIAALALRTSLLPCALIIPHPQSVILMERALIHKDTQRHWE